MMTTKQCSYCRAVKELRDFYKHPTSAHGVGNRCRACTAERGRKYRRSHQDLGRVRACIEQMRQVIERIDALIGKEGE